MMGSKSHKLDVQIWTKTTMLLEYQAIQDKTHHELITSISR